MTKIYRITKKQFIAVIIIALIAIKDGVSIVGELLKLFLKFLWSFLGVINNIMLLNDQSVLGLAFGELIAGIIVGNILSQFDIRGLPAGILRRILLVATSTIAIAILNELSKIIFR